MPGMGWNLAWEMAPPLAPMPLLIMVLVVCCEVLFLTRSTREIRQQMYDRIYGPGARRPRREWWEEDLDPIFASKLQKWKDRLSGRRS